MKKNPLIIVRPENCQGCNACVRHCRAKEANKTVMLEDGRFITTVNPDKCIACGECVRVCEHGARDYVDDTAEAMEFITKNKAIIIAAPAIKTTFPDRWKNILNFFRSKGCEIYDVSFGADICTWAHLKALETKRVGTQRVDKLITQPCAAIVNYIELYQPQLLKYLSPIHSPMLCEVVYLRKYENKTAPIIALSPCVAKKTEFEETGLVKFNLTFKKLKEYFERNEIRIPLDDGNNFDYDFDGTQGQLGSIYPRPSGLMENLLAHDPSLLITAREGVQTVYDYLDTLAKAMNEGKETLIPAISDVLSCQQGCNIGAGTGTTLSQLEILRIMHTIEECARDRREIKNGGIRKFFRGAEDTLFKRFDEILKLDDFTRKYERGEASPEPTDEELEPIFLSMNKRTDAERHLNCNACGNVSCREMAIAIYRGLNIPENCNIFAKQHLHMQHQELTEKHSQLSDVADTCKEISEKLLGDVKQITGKMADIRDANDVTTEKAKQVSDLLQNVVKFCEANPEMNEDTTGQLINILNITLEAFNNLDRKVQSSSMNTLSVDACIMQIQDLVGDLNKTLTAE